MAQVEDYKPALLLDECITIRLVNPEDKKRFLHSVDLVGRGASDTKVMQVAKERKFMLLTHDRELAYRCIFQNIPVAYYDARRNETHLLNSNNCVRHRRYGNTIFLFSYDERLPLRLDLAVYFLPIFNFQIENRQPINIFDLKRLKIRLCRRIRGAFLGLSEVARGLCDCYESYKIRSVYTQFAAEHSQRLYSDQTLALFAACNVEA